MAKEVTAEAWAVKAFGILSMLTLPGTPIDEKGVESLNDFLDLAPSNVMAEGSLFLLGSLIEVHSER